MSGTEWNKIAQKLLVGKRIKAVSYMTQQEADDHGWDRKAVMIELEDGTTIYPSADDEGNGAGALFTTDKKVPILPVL